MALIKLKVYKITMKISGFEEDRLIEADSFAEAEKLAIEQFKKTSRFSLKAISEWYINTYKKVD